MKRTALALSFALVLGLTGCSNDDEADTATTEDTVADSTTDTAADNMSDDTTTTEADDAAAEGNIVEVAQGAGNFTTLIAAAQAAGLAETLSTDELTVFAPTDEAFTAALGSLGITADELLADTEKLKSILLYHVVPGKVMAEQVVTMGGQEVETAGGQKVTITVDGSTVKVNDATVTTTDIEASNGVIHVIDSVLLPPA